MIGSGIIYDFRKTKYYYLFLDNNVILGIRLHNGEISAKIKFNSQSVQTIQNDYNIQERNNVKQLKIV